MGRPMTAEAVALRQEVVDAVQVELAAGRAPDRAEIGRQFRNRVAPTTLGRWIDAALADHPLHNPEPCSGVSPKPRTDVGAPVSGVVEERRRPFSSKPLTLPRRLIGRTCLPAGRRGSWRGSISGGSSSPTSPAGARR